MFEDVAAVRGVEVGEVSEWSGRLPGPGLAAALAAVDLAGLDDGELVDVVAAWRRQASWVQAGELAAIAELGRRREAGSSRAAEFASAEVGLALTRVALVEGRIDLVKAGKSARTSRTEAHNGRRAWQIHRPLTHLRYLPI